METSHEDSESGGLICTPANVYSVFRGAGLSCSFRVLGSQLGLDPQDLNEVESAPYNERLIKLLAKCSDRSSLTWSWIVQVLKKPALGEFSIARSIERRYVSESSSSAGFDSRSLSLSSSLTSSDVLSPTSSTSMEIGRKQLSCYN